MMENPKIIFTNEDEKLIQRLAMSYSDRFHALMKSIRLKRKFQQAIIIKPKAE